MSEFFGANKKYKTIYADPPWMERGAGECKRGADRHYQLMSTKDICKIPVEELAGENCHLYLWTTNNFLPDGLMVMRAWGFRYVTMITWVKDRIGLGQYFRGMTEHCLFGVKGYLDYKVDGNNRIQGKTVIHAPRIIHSRKPQEMREMIERVSYSPRIELFARTPDETPLLDENIHTGWDVWGNETISVKHTGL